MAATLIKNQLSEANGGRLGHHHPLSRVYQSAYNNKHVQNRVYSCGEEAHTCKLTKEVRVGGNVCIRY